MATYDKHGAKGSMILNQDWEEDSQGRNEYFNECADIKADPSNDKFVILTIKNGKHDYWKGKEAPSVSEYKISALRKASLYR